ncbi:MAG: LamG-like jellyroll fold domain-containing protein [Verrucomicrobiota bacterium]
MKEEEFEQRAQEWLNGQLDQGTFAEFQDELRKSPVFRERFRRLANLDSGLRDLALVESTPPAVAGVSASNASKSGWLALAAAVAVLGVATWISFSGTSGEDSFVAGPETHGVAVVTAEAGAVWSEEKGTTPTQGAPLAPGVLFLEEGLAQIDFFGGASISLSGPAEIELVNRDKAVLHRGRLRADVPPAARGFEILTADVRLEDLGTTFGLAVGDDNSADLIVFDGEVVAHGEGDPISLTDGEAARLVGGSASRRNAEGLGRFPDIAEVFAGSGNDEEQRYANWKEASLELRNDPRLVAYYDFENLTPVSRRLRNRASSGSEFDGGIVGARVASGRWGDKSALDFRREGDRVRFDIPGEFDALTLFAWVRIDALDRNLNSLFLTEYFDEREIHWQLSRDGVIHFACSPMGVIDIDQHNRRFYSESFWDPGQSGQWFFIATTVEATAVTGGSDPVHHYVNGRRLGFSGGTQMQKPIPRMRIGEADLGNWSEPIQPRWALRTLNGRIDEFAIFREALTAEEISTLYENGKP